jgi:ABC-type amino acid transport substrate-binding protein
MTLRILGASVALVIAAACSGSSGPSGSSSAKPGAPGEIPAAPQPVNKLERITKSFSGDLDAIAARGYVRILVAPSRTYFQTADGTHQGLAVDAGVALARKLAEAAGRDIVPVFIETREDQLIPALLAGRGDAAANVRVTAEREEQVAFAPPIKTGIRQLIVTDVNPLGSLEDVGGRIIHVRRNSDHHASVVRLNEQLKARNRRQAAILFDDKAATEEDLLDSVNAGRIRATIADDYIFDRWQRELLKVAATNRDVAVSEDGAIAWASRKDAPDLAAILKDFFSTHKLSF